MKSKMPVFIGAGIAGLIILIILFSSSFVTIQPGNKGILFRKFGGGLDKDHVYGQGFHVLAPWNNMFVYDVRIQERLEQLDVLAKNGLSIHIELSVRFRLLQDEVGYIHDEIGSSYADKIVIPQIRSATRNTIGKYLPEELYSSKRETIQTEIFEDTRLALEPKHIILDAVLIRSVKLPATIEAAIESKLKQEQEAAAFEWKIKKETKEAERKRIEAQGIKDFQDIVSEGISEKLLRWKGIEATTELANSTNSKIVVIGSGKDGLPLIMNQ